MLFTDHFKGWCKNAKTGCRNTKFGQEKDLSAHVWSSCAAWAHEEDNMKQTKTTERYTVHCWDCIKDIEIYKSRLQLWGK